MTISKAGEIVHTYSDNWEEVDDNYTVCVVKFDSNENFNFTKYLAAKHFLSRNTLCKDLPKKSL